MNIGRLLKKAGRAVKENPEIALMVLGVVAPKAARKVAEKIAEAKIAKHL